MRRVAIIPARGGSKRLPRKNILDFMGKPMLAYPILCAKKSGLFEKIIVSTKDREIADIAEDFGANVMERPLGLTSDNAQVISVCHDLLMQLDEKGEKPDLFCCLYPTSVFLEPEDLIQSEKMLHEKNADVVMGVSGYSLHPYKAMQDVNGFLNPAFPEHIRKQSQNYPDFVASNGSLYWAKVGCFMEVPDFYPKRLSGYEIPNIRAPDIDTMEDYEYAKLLAKIVFERKGGVETI